MAKKLLFVFFVFFLCYNNSFSQATTTTQIFTTGTSFTIPCGVTSVTVEAWGGGGAGGGSRQDGRAGGGGGGGGYVMKTFAVIAGETITYSIGTGGTGSIESGTAGGNTTVTHTSSTTSLIANGGNGGERSNGYPNDGGAGGTASGGSVNKTGIAGSNVTGGSTGGNGGASGNGGGAGGDGRNNNNGRAGSIPGGGGGGGEYDGNNRSGGAGGAGLIRITYFTPTTTTLTTTNATVCQGGTANLQAVNPNTTITTFSGSWISADTTREPRFEESGSPTTCTFDEANPRPYNVMLFSVNVSGTYEFKMTDTGNYDGIAYIVSPDFEPGNCGGGGTFYVGDDDDTGSSTEPRFSVALTAGVAYKLISTTWDNITLPQNFIWNVTSAPSGGGIVLPAATVRWYTASSGGTSIGTGASFNPVGVPGSGLANSNTPGTTTFYAAYGDACGTRMPATYTVTAITPTTQVGTTANTFCMNSDPPVIITAPVNSGQYVSVNVVSGFTYSFAVGDVFSGASETLTILNNSNANFSPVASVTGATGTAINNWVAPSSGVIRVVLTSSTCANGTTGGALTLTQNLLGNNLDSQTAFGTDNWVGHIYNAGGATPTAPFASANYAGYYLEPDETINQGFGGSGTCFPVLSNGTQRASIYTEGYAVRYRMRTTKRGCYLVSITGDDGVRLFLNGTNILDRWQEQSATTYSNILVTLSDTNRDFIFEYYENAGDNQVNFSMIPFDAATNTITPATSTVCSGTAVNLNGSDYLINGQTNPYMTFQWQSSPDNAAPWTNIATTEDISVSPTTTTYYRRQVIPNNPTTCTTLTSSSVVINVATPTLNTVAQAATVCQGAAATINLTGLLPSSTSTIAYSINGTAQTAVANVVANPSGNASFSTVALTATNNGQTLSVTGVTTTSSTPNCSTAFTNKTLVLSVTPTVGTPTAITISAGTQPTCQLTNGTTTTTYATTATNSTGFTWSLSNGSAGSINATTGVVTWANGFSGSVNIQVQASGCNGASAMVTRTVNISPASVGGTVSPASTCFQTATNSITLTLAGHTGSVVRWESSTNNFSTTPTTIANTTASLPLTNVLVTTYYRAIVQSGTCDTATSSVATVITGPVTASAASATTCTGFTANWAKVPGASTYLLDVSTNNFSSFVGIYNGYDVGDNASRVVAGLTANTAYQYRVWPIYPGCGTYATASTPISVTTSTLTTVPAIGGGASAVCVGLTTPAFTNATAGGTWSITNGTGQATISTGGVVTGVTAGTVTVVYSITSSGGCSNTATRALTVNALPVITTQPVALAVCQGGSGNFTIATSATSPTYQWQYANSSGGTYENIPTGTGVVSGETSATLSWTNTNIAYNGFYIRCIVTSGAGCTTTSNAVRLTVNTLPTPTFTAQAGVQACINTNVTYTTQTGSGINNYVWGFTGTAGTDYQIMSGGGLNDNTVTVRYLTLGNKTATVNYRNSNNCYAAAAATSTATNITPTSAGGTVSGSHILCSGNAPLSSLISGGGRIGNVVRWERSTNTSFSPLTTIANNTDTLTSAEIGALTVTTYFRAIAVSGSCSEAASTYATITVPVAPAVPTAQAVSNVTCSQVQANWTAATNAASYVLEVASDNAFATLVYNQNVGNNLSQTVTGLAAGTYYYRVYAENTCSNRGGNSGTITFNTTATLAPLATAATPNCTGFVAFWNSVSGATDYRLDVSTSNTFSSFVTNGNGTVLNGATVSGLTYAVTGLVPGTTYYYRVRANNVTCGDSANSNTITITAGSPTTATWDGLAWSPAPPTFADNILFTGDYISTVDLNGCSCIVNNDADIVISSTNTLTLTHTVNVATGSTMTFENNASLLQNTDAQNTGLIKYKRITTPIYKFDFTFWSSPVQGFTLEKLSPSTLSDKYQGYDGANSKWTTLSRTLTMSPGTAYNIRGPQGHLTPAPYLATFEGTPNNGPYELTGLVAGKFYLAGNPYPSPINVLDFLDLNEDIIEGTIYFWTHATPIAPNGSVYSYGSDDYAARNYLGGTAAQPDGRIPSDYISAAQGFFMKTITTDPVRFNNDMRVSTAEGENAQFFKPGKTAKTAATSKRSRVWLSISNGLGAYKQTLLGYAEGASNSYDSKYDGVSFSANKNLNLYTLNEDKKFAIQGRAYPVQESDVVPLGYVANLEGEFSIAIDKTDGTLTSQAIYLEDKLTGTIYDLKASKYTFTTAKGTFNDRFVLRYTKKTLGNDDFENVEGGLVVTVKDKVIKVISASESIQSVTIFDLTGKLLFNKQKIEATEFAIPNLHSSEQTLLVKVGLENGTTATRKIIFN